MTETLEQLIKTAGSALDMSFTEVNIEHPDILDFGDYSTNIALVYAKKLSKNPREIAENLVQKINEDLPVFLSKVEVAGAGFINFYLSSKFFVGSLNEICSDENFGKGELLSGKSALFEYTDPNPFKAFHIGHLMANAIGESMSRIAEFEGAKVTRICYQGDIGLHVAKTIWAMKKARLAMPEDSAPFEEKIKFMGDAYVIGVNAYEDDESAKTEIKEINKQLFEKSDSELQKLYDKGKEWSLQYFDAIYKKLGTKFDDFIFESEVSPEAVKIVKANLGKVFEESNGAIVFKGEKYGLHTRVFLNSQGLPTYEAKDLANAMEKSKRHKFDISVITSANEINDYFKVVLKAMSLIDEENASKTLFLGHGMLRFAEGKMSSRKGNIITGESLLNETENEVLVKMEGRDFEESEKESVASKVAIGAIKYAILRQSIGKDIIFDKEKAISFEGDSGPYLQYSFVRSKSLLAKALKEGVEASVVNAPDSHYEIERELYKFPEIVAQAWQEKSAHYISEYLTHLCALFNSFYASDAIVSQEPNSPYRIAVTKAFSNIMKNGLWLLGISSVEKM